MVVIDSDAPEDLNIVVAVLDHEGAAGVTAEVRRPAAPLGTVHQDAVADELVPDHCGKRRTVGVDGCEAAEAWSVKEPPDPRIANS